MKKNTLAYMYAYHAPSFDDIASNSNSNMSGILSPAFELSGILSPAFELSSTEDYSKKVQFHENQCGMSFTRWLVSRNKDYKI